MEIKTDAEYQAVLKRVWEIWRDEVAVSNADEFDELVGAIEAYEDRMDWFNEKGISDGEEEANQ